MSLNRRFPLVMLATLLTLQLFSAGSARAEFDSSEVMDPSTLDQSEEETNGLELKWSKLLGEPKDEDYHSSEYAFGNGIYVTTEGYTSKDGVHWSRNPNLKEHTLYKVIFGKGIFIGFGYRGRDDQVPVYISKDGINWTENTQRIDTYFIEGAAFNGTRFVATGNKSAEVVYTSEDGVKWTTRKHGLKSGLGDVAWGNGVFVALSGPGGVLGVSKDGIKWTKTTVPIKDYYHLNDILYAAGTFVAIGDYALATSKDGIKWTSIPSEGMYWGRVLRVKDRFFLEGFKYADERKKQDTIKILRTSKDGKQWVDLQGFGPLSNKDVSYGHADTVYDGTQYVTYLNKGIYTSADGVKWKQIKKIPLIPPVLFRAAVGDGTLVAVGGITDYFDPEVEKLAERGSWQINSRGASKYNVERGNFPLYDVIWTGKQFFGIGYQGLMMTSTDGLKWVKAATPTKETLSRIIQADGTYYIVGDQGLILSSKDLKTWKKHQTSAKENLNSIAWDGKTFVAAGENGLLLVSDDGSTWTKIKKVSSDNYADITWGNGTFVVVSPVGTGTAFKSNDGRKWSRVMLDSGIRASGQSTGLFGVCYTGDMFVALGREGTILLSRDAKKWTRQDFTQDLLFYSAQAFNGKLYVFGYTDIYTADL